MDATNDGDKDSVMDASRDFAALKLDPSSLEVAMALSDDEQLEDLHRVYKMNERIK